MTAATKILDLDAVQSFVLLASLSNFTRVAEASGTTQAAVSLKLKRLEASLGRRLVERTPRSVQLTPDGAAFLDHARTLLAANARALSFVGPSLLPLRLGFSDHAIGGELPTLLERLSAATPSVTLQVTTGFSSVLLAGFDGGDFDGIIVRQEAGRRGGEVLCNDEFGWFAAPRFTWRRDEPLRLANLAPPCGVRAMALRALEKARIPWTEAYIGGGVGAVAAAVSAGLAVAALSRRVAPVGSVDVGRAFGLPRLPPSKVLLHSRLSDSRGVAALRILAAAFRGFALA